MSQVGSATKAVGKGAVKGATDATQKAGDVTKDAAKKTTTATKNTGKTVEGAVTPGQTSAHCKDGTVQTGKTKTEACRGHRGVKN